MATETIRQLRSIWFWVQITFVVVNIMFFYGWKTYHWLSWIGNWTLLGLALFQTIYVYSLRKDAQPLFIKIYGWCYSIALWVLWIAYISSYNHLPEFALIALLLLFVTILLGSLFSILHSLLTSRTNLLITVSYLALSFTIIAIFGFSYTILTAYDSHRLEVVNNQTTVTHSTTDLILYSAFVYYSNAFGEYVPHDIARYFVVTELALSAVVHIIILGSIIKSKL